jgi:hypothetical protein
MSTVAQPQADIEVTTATHPTPIEALAAALGEPAIKEAIQRGARKAQVKKYAAVTESARDGACEHTSDFEQETYLALLEHHVERFAALAAEERAQFVEKLAKSIAWKQVYRMKREVPLAKPLNGDQNGGDGPETFACDDISLNGQNKHANYVSARAIESDLIGRIDRQRAETTPEEQPETTYDRMCRLLGAQKADWMLDYENRRYESAKTPADRVRYFRLRKKLAGM